MKNEKMRVIIDTDPGVDDAMAILMILAAPNIEVLAITTVAGNSTIENVSKNAKYILDIAGRSDIPIYVGGACPLKKQLITADVHGQTGLGNIDLSKMDGATSEISASEKLAELIESNPDQITILALGPLTNIAMVLLSNKDLQNKVMQLVMMGGAIDVPGNKSAFAEFNFFVDPEAAKIVFESNLPKALVPLDLCNQVIMQESDIAKLGEGKVAKFLRSILTPYALNIGKLEGLNGAVMYDPLAAYYLTDEAAFTTREMSIRIQAEGELSAGMSVADKSSLPTWTPNVRVAMSVDQDKFIQDVYTAIKKLDSNIKSE
ncbi:MAG: nucleoside hydrolase [Candidatus Berkelbacteria bacterium]